MKTLIAGLLLKSWMFGIAFCLCHMPVSAMAVETVLYEDDFSEGNIASWSEFVPGVRRKCQLAASWAGNDGEGFPALRLQLCGLAAEWAGVRCESFRVPWPGTIKVSFMIKAKSGSKCMLTLSGAAQKWLEKKVFDLSRKYQAIEFAFEYDRKAFEAGSSISFRLHFKNNTDVFVRSVRITLE